MRVPSCADRQRGDERKRMSCHLENLRSTGAPPFLLFSLGEMSYEFGWEPLSGENSFEEYRELIGPLTHDAHWKALDAERNFLDKTNEFADGLMQLEDKPLRFPPLVEPEEAMALSHATTILARRSDYFAINGRKAKAVDSALSALKLSKKILHGKGTIGLYMYGAACEARVLHVIRRRLGQHFYGGVSKVLLDNFPDHRGNARLVADSYRTEFQWALNKEESTLEELQSPPLELNWLGGVSIAENLAPWPDGLDLSYIDEEETLAGLKQMIRAELDFYEGKAQVRASCDHLWADLPERPHKLNRPAIEKFNRTVFEIKNPLGKSCLRNASKSYRLIHRIALARSKRIQSARFWTSILARRKL